MEPNWIEQVLKECNDVETPISWLWWSLCCSISAAAGNNYYLTAYKGNVTYKPNIYVILLGKPGLGKAFPVYLAKSLVQRANVTRVIAGRSSIQAIIEELGTGFSREKKDPITDSRAFIVNGELSTAIIRDEMALTALTDLYDGNVNPDWANRLKSDGIGGKELKDPYITYLFGSSQAHFYASIPRENIEGGFIRRNLVVLAEKRAKDIDPFDESDEYENRVQKIIVPKYYQHLEHISNLNGKITVSQPAKDLFNKWKREWRSNQQEDSTGFLNSVPDHVLKTCMILTLAKTGKNFDLLVSDYDMEESIERVTDLVYASHKAIEGHSDVDPLAAVTKLILDLFLTASNHQLKRKQIQNNLYARGIVDSAIIDRALENLFERKWLSRERINRGSSTDWMYHLTGEPLAQYEQFKKRKVQ